MSFGFRDVYLNPNSDIQHACLDKSLNLLLSLSFYICKHGNNNSTYLTGLRNKKHTQVSSSEYDRQEISEGAAATTIVTTTTTTTS